MSTAANFDTIAHCLCNDLPLEVLNGLIRHLSGDPKAHINDMTEDAAIGSIETYLSDIVNS